MRKIRAGKSVAYLAPVEWSVKPGATAATPVVPEGYTIIGMRCVGDREWFVVQKKIKQPESE